jgi:hypothetical protein
MITDVTALRPISHESATWAALTPLVSPMETRVSTMFQRRSSSRIGGSVQPANWRVPSGAAWFRRCLPDSRPPAIGLQTRTPRPWSMADRQELVFGVAGFQRVVDLLADEALAVFALADAERLHDVPAGEIRAADVADLALAHERIERFHRFFERRLAVPFVHLVEIDDIGLQALEAGLAGAIR